MSSVTITINTDNHAFQGPGYKAYEIVRILRELSRNIEESGIIGWKLRDINGNPVGEVKIDNTR
jgi:hypothetical protein